MNIPLPTTLTARYDSDTWTEAFYETNGSGTVTIQFGGHDVLKIRIEEGGSRFEADLYRRYTDDANENLSEFVAEWLAKIFGNALASDR